MTKDTQLTLASETHKCGRWCGSMQHGYDWSCALPLEHDGPCQPERTFCKKCGSERHPEHGCRCDADHTVGYCQSCGAYGADLNLRAIVTPLLVAAKKWRDSRLIFDAVLVAKAYDALPHELRTEDDDG